MAVKTVRFNKAEEVMLKKILVYYGSDFSNCVKELLVEKLEDLQDIGVIKRIKEEKKENYFCARDIDELYE